MLAIMPEPTSPSRHVLDQIAALPNSDRPLIICDVDEVILHMISHLERYLADREMAFLNFEYRLTGNIVRKGDTTPLPAETVRRLLDLFFDEESHRQQPVDGAEQALSRLAANWDIVLLTNLPGGHNKPVRENLLRNAGIPFPVLTNSGPKGGAAAALSAGRPDPVVFIDDSPGNHRSVHASLPGAVQIQFVADPRFLALIEPADHIALQTGDWGQTADFIGAILPQS